MEFSHYLFGKKTATNMVLMIMFLQIIYNYILLTVSDYKL